MRGGGGDSLRGGGGGGWGGGGGCLPCHIAGSYLLLLGFALKRYEREE